MFQTTCLTPLPNLNPKLLLKKCTLDFIFFLILTCLTLVKTEIKTNEELKLV